MARGMASVVRWSAVISVMLLQMMQVVDVDGADATTTRRSGRDAIRRYGDQNEDEDELDAFVKAVAVRPEAIQDPTPNNRKSTVTAGSAGGPDGSGGGQRSSRNHPRRSAWSPPDRTGNRGTGAMTSSTPSTSRVETPNDVDVGGGGASNQFLSLLLDVSRRLAGLEDAVDEIRLQNQMTYRQLKRMTLKWSAAATAAGYQPERNDGERSSAIVKPGAMLADVPQSDQHPFALPQLKSPHTKSQKLQSSLPRPSQQSSKTSAPHHQPSAPSGRNPSTKTVDLQLQQPAPADRCPSEFTYSAELDTCYRLSGDRTTWRLARQRCRDLKSDLATVDSAREQRYLNERARAGQDTRHCDFWIGLVRGRGSGPEAASTWHWIGDVGNGQSPNYVNWNVNEPNNANSYEHCAQMLWVFNWRWNDAHCNYGNACYVCQAKPKPRGGP